MEIDQSSAPSAGLFVFGQILSIRNQKDSGNGLPFVNDGDKMRGPAAAFFIGRKWRVRI
jgi:hypothetical protein